MERGERGEGEGGGENRLRSNVLENRFLTLQKVLRLQRCLLFLFVFI